MPKIGKLVVFSHLRWDFVYQRPQHLLSRIAREWPVVFIEEPIHAPDRQPRWERMPVEEKGVTVLRPHTPVGEGGFNDAQMPYLKNLLDQLIDEENLEGCAVWLYTPMALPLAQHMGERMEVLVFDAMDELSAFKFAPPQLIEREAETMREADVVFTGGISLYRAKQSRHHNIHAFPSSVDAPHFRKALHTEEAGDQAHLPHPRLGYYGVIDERIDLALIDYLAKSHPEWQIVMVGPVVKIGEDELPRHPNIHYMGQRPYEQLPQYLAGWDVCLMPFALNESTRYISPTKSLEYMAAEKPVVSTPITDVVEPYGNIVGIGHNPAEFTALCEQALVETEGERDRRITAYREVLQRTSWDETASAMMALIGEAAAGRTRQERGSVLAPA
jgi:UDP-galactopyranose mutase